MNADQLVVWNSFLAGRSTSRRSPGELQQITDKVANDASVKKVEVK